MNRSPTKQENVLNGREREVDNGEGDEGETDDLGMVSEVYV
jgi:hypothetical protein